jgi:hypothetical protein
LYFGSVSLYVHVNAVAMGVGRVESKEGVILLVLA